MIFILGGNGFVGSAFSRYCQKHNIEYSIITRENYDSFKGKSCNILINANGNSSKVLSSKEPFLDFELTVTSVKKCLNDFNFKKYVYLSSCDVYVDTSSQEITKEDTHIDVSKQSTYGFHKLLAEECVKNFSSNWLIVRLGGMVGKNLKKNAIFDILNGDPLWLNPNSKLQYINTDDVARIVFQLIDKNMNHEIFNLCGDGMVKLNDLISDINSLKINNGLTITYDINIEKIKTECIIPDSQKTIKEFMQEYECERK